MSHMHLKRIYTLLLRGEMFWRYQLNTSALVCHLRQPFPVDFLLARSLHWSQWDVKLPSYESISVILSFYVYQDWLYIFRCSYTEYKNVYKATCSNKRLHYSLLLDCSPYHYVVFFFLFLTIICVLVYFVNISIATIAFFSFPFAWNIFFHPLLLVCVYILF